MSRSKRQVKKASKAGGNKADNNALRELTSRMNPTSSHNVNPGIEPTTNPLTGQQINPQSSRSDRPNTVFNPQSQGNQFVTNSDIKGTSPQGPTVYDPNNSGGGGNQLGYNAALPNTQLNQAGANVGLGAAGEGEQYNLLVEEGVSGLTRFGGFVYEEWLAELQGRRGALTYREMRDNDAIIGAAMYAIEMLIRQVNWRVEAAGETPQDVEAMEFLETCMDDMSLTWHDMISEILTFMYFGWCYMELCYKIREGPDQPSGVNRSKYEDKRIGWRKWAIRAQETLWRWRFDADGSIRGMEQIAPPDYKLRYIPIEKAILFRTKSNKNNPEGRSILRNAYRSWYIKKGIEEIEAIGIERDLAGYPMLRIPPEIFEQGSAEAISAYNSWRKLITRIKRDEQEGIMLPSAYDDAGNKLYELEMIKTGGARRQFDTNQIIQRYENRIAMTIMADFLTLGHEKSGSYSLGENKTSLFQLALGTILQNISDTINTFAVPRLFKLNNFQGLTDFPKIVHDEIEKVNLDQLSNYVQRLTTVGSMQSAGDEELENYLRQAASLPKRPDYFDTPSLPIDNSNTENKLLGIQKQAQGEVSEYIEEIRKLRKEMIKKGGV